MFLGVGREALEGEGIYIYMYIYVCIYKIMSDSHCCMAENQYGIVK